MSRDFQNALAALARTLPDGDGPDPQLRARTLANLPPQSAPVAPSRWARRSLAAGAVVLVAIGIGAFAGPRWAFIGTPSVAAAEVRAALQRVNTWHLTGWKLRNGKKVRWEVWGRRTPYFYREQVGPDVTYDDGERRFRLLSTDPENGRKRPVALAMFPSRTAQPSAYRLPAEVPGSVTIPSPDSFLDDDRKGGNVFALVQREGAIVTLRRAEGTGMGANLEDYYRYLKVNTQTKLPLSFEWRVDRKPNPNAPRDAIKAPAKNYASGYLEAQYDVPLQPNIAQIPEDALMIDLTTPNDGSVPTENAATKNGLTLQAASVAHDANGLIRVQYAAWLGNQRLNFKTMGVSLELPVAPFHQYSDKTEPLRDDRGNVYLEIPSPPRTDSGDGPERYYAPIDPLDANALPAQWFTIGTYVYLTAYETNPETGYAERIPVGEESIELPMTLPPPSHDLGYETITADDDLGPGQPRWTLKLEIAEARANYYHAKAVGLKEARPKAFQYYREALAEARRSKNRRVEDSAQQNLHSLEEMIKRYPLR